MSKQLSLVTCGRDGASPPPGPWRRYQNVVAAVGTDDDAFMMKEGERSLAAKRDAVASSSMSS